MNDDQQQTLKSIFSEPIPYDMEWQKIEDLFKALDASVVEGIPSRVRFELGGVVATFYRPDPQAKTMPYQLRDARAFLEKAGVKL